MGICVNFFEEIIVHTSILTKKGQGSEKRGFIPRPKDGRQDHKWPLAAVSVEERNSSKFQFEKIFPKHWR